MWCDGSVRKPGFLAPRIRAGFFRGFFPGEVPGSSRNFPRFWGFQTRSCGGVLGVSRGVQICPIATSVRALRVLLPSPRKDFPRLRKKNYLSRKISRPENCYMVTRRSSDSDDRIGDDGDRKRGRAAPGSWRATWSILVGDVEDRLARTSETRSERQRVEHRGSPFLAELRSGQGNAPDATCWRRGGPLQDRSYSRPVRKRT